MEEYHCYLCNKVFGEKRSLIQHLYSHLTRGDDAPKEKDQVVPETNIDDEMDNVTASNFVDGDTKGSNASKGCIDSASLKQKRKRRCKS